MLRRGFTIVELIITITIMAILMVLAVVNITGSQLSARDDQRVGDVQTISSYLEIFYNTGTNGSTVFHRYPSTAINASWATVQSNLPDADIKAFQAPGVTDPTLTFIAASNNTQTTAGVAPQPTISQYVYQPLQADGTLCTLTTQECRKFNLYYHTEGDNAVHVVTSKNQ